MQDSNVLTVAQTNYNVTAGGGVTQSSCISNGTASFSNDRRSAQGHAGAVGVVHYGVVDGAGRRQLFIVAASGAADGHRQGVRAIQVGVVRTHAADDGGAAVAHGNGGAVAVA